MSRQELFEKFSDFYHKKVSTSPAEEMTILQRLDDVELKIVEDHNNLIKKLDYIINVLDKVLDKK